MHYVITGGAGFIGSHLAELLLQQGAHVTILDDFSTGKRENLHGMALDVYEGSICSRDDVEQAMQQADGVFHLAAIASVTKSVEEWAATHRVNQSGAVEVFECAARRGIPVVYASSAAVYGDNDALPLIEAECPAPLSPYGLDKLACEWQAKIGHSLLGLSSVGMRFFNVYGSRQDPASPYSGVISIFMQRCKEQRDITIFGDGEQSRDFVYVKDVVQHLLRAMEKLHQRVFANEVLNVCTGQQTSVNELAQQLIRLSRAPIAVHHAPTREGDIRFSCGSPQKAIERLQLSAQVPLQEGLKETWDFFLRS